MSINNRTVVISGATGLLSSFVARELAKKGVNLALLDIHSDKLASLLKDLGLADGRVFSRAVDLLDPLGIKTAAEAISSKFGKIEVLLHLVGGWSGGKLLINANSEDLTNMLNRHIWTSFNVIQAFVPYIIKNGWGRIIMVTSPHAARPNVNGGIYAIGKSGQEALMNALSRELEGSGVTANMLQVKSIDVKREKLSSPTPENASWTTPEELVGAILFLLSDEAGNINGSKIPLHGSY